MTALAEQTAPAYTSLARWNMEHPRGAFANSREGQQLFGTAFTYWCGTKSGQPVPVLRDGEVWPPPPRLG